MVVRHTQSELPLQVKATVPEQESFPPWHVPRPVTHCLPARISPAAQVHLPPLHLPPSQHRSRRSHVLPSLTQPAAASSTPSLASTPPRTPPARRRTARRRVPPPVVSFVIQSSKRVPSMTSPPLLHRATRRSRIGWDCCSTTPSPWSLRRCDVCGKRPQLCYTVGERLARGCRDQSSSAPVGSSPSERVDTVGVHRGRDCPTCCLRSPWPSAAIQRFVRAGSQALEVIDDEDAGVAATLARHTAARARSGAGRRRHTVASAVRLTDKAAAVVLGATRARATPLALPASPPGLAQAAAASSPPRRTKTPPKTTPASRFQIVRRVDTVVSERVSVSKLRSSIVGPPLP